MEHPTRPAPVAATRCGQSCDRRRAGARPAFHPPPILEYRAEEIPVAYGGTFGIPEDARIIATMSTADRSIALVDHALRRRFAFMRLAPNDEVLRRFHHNAEYQVDGLVDLLTELNAEIRDEDYQVGMSLFLTPELPEHIEDIWRTA